MAATVLPSSLQPHVEGLDLLRVVGARSPGRLKTLLGQVALVLGLQVDAPLDRELERLAAAFAGARPPRCR